MLGGDNIVPVTKYKADHLKGLRLAAGFKTLKEVHIITKISISMLSSIENGCKLPSPQLAAKLVQAYKCSYNDIFLPYDFTVGE
jgi:hypothetical protein